MVYKFMETQKEKEPVSLIYRLAIILVVGYLTLAISFYFLAGEQLHLRESRGTIELPVADSSAVELVAGNSVEQRFIGKIQRLETVSVQWGTAYRPNMGTVVVELYNLQDNTLIMSGNFDAAAIAEGGLTTIEADQPVEGLYAVPLLLKVYSPDGQMGTSVSPLISTQTTVEEGFELLVNGVQTQGVLCFTVTGTDYIWTGLHYWEFVIAGLAILLVCLTVIWYRCRKGKRSYIYNVLIAMKKYQFLIRQLVSRDFKTKYKRSVLGVLWSFFNPLLTMMVQYFVFSTIFRSDISNFPAYLIIGTVMFNFFSESCGMALGSILGNASLINKVYVPKYIYPLTRVLSSLVNLLISLIPLIVVCAVTGVTFHKSAILSLFFLLCLVVFCLGIGLVLSTSMVFFRDTQFLWNVFNLMWMYATPIFYPETIIPENMKLIHTLNPLYYFLQNARMCILDGISPEPAMYAKCFFIALGTLLIGAIIFRKNQDKFVLYM